MSTDFKKAKATNVHSMLKICPDGLNLVKDLNPVKKVLASA